MSTATQALPVMHRMHAHVSDGVVTHDWSHEDHYVTAAEAIANRARRLKDMGHPYVIDGMTLSFLEPDGYAYTLTYEDVQA